MRPRNAWAGTIAVLAMVVSACGAGDIEASPDDTATVLGTTVVSVPSTSGPATTTTSSSIASTTTTTAPTTTTTAPLPVVEGVPAADFTVELEGGGTFALAEQRRPVLLFYWATWCHSCHEMMPIIDRIAVDYGDRLAVLTVAKDSDPVEAAEDFAENFPGGAALLTHDLELSLTEAYAIPGNPVTVLILGEVEAQRWMGLAKDADIRAAIDALLALLPPS
jgi:thiol-disulfide isomerase/thioredoxin